MPHYVTRNPQSAISAIEVSPSLCGDETTIALYARDIDTHGVDKLLKDSQLDYQKVAKTRLDNTPIILISTTASPEQFMQRLTPATGGFEEKQLAENKAPVDLMKVRGVLGNIGQVMMIASGITASKYGDKGGQMKAMAAGTSLVANSINWKYGVQKREDVKGLVHFKENINNEVLAASGQQAASSFDLPDASRRVTASSTEDEKVDSLLEQNSTTISDGIKFGAKVLLAISGEKSGNVMNKWSGMLSQGAKVVGMTGKDKDTFDEVKKSPETASEYASWFVNNIRENSMFFAGITELNANALLLPGAFPKGGKADWLQFAGTSFILAGLAARSMAPFSIQTINQEELLTHAGMALAHLPEGEVRQKHMLEVASDMKELPQNSHIPLTDIYVDVVAHTNQALQQVGDSKGTSASPLAPLVESKPYSEIVADNVQHDRFQAPEQSPTIV